METVRKITKRDNYDAIMKLLDICESNGVFIEDEDITYDSLRKHVNNELSILDRKAESAAKRATKKREEGDELREKIYAVLDDEYMIIDDIVKLLDNEYSQQEITPRISQLIKLGRVEKDKVTVEASVEGGKTRHRTGYRRIG